MRNRRIRRLLPALLLALGLGCASGPAPRDHYYRIEVAAPAPLPSPVIAGTLEVDRLRVESISQGRHMLYREASRPEEIAEHAYHYWADPPSVMIQDQLVRYLRAAGVAKEVVTPAVRVGSDFVVSGRIIRLERLLGSGEPRVAVEIELTLTREEGHELLLLHTYREERAAPGAGVADAVVAYDQAIGSIFERFVADVPRS